MSIASEINFARAFLPANPGAYARAMSSLIRSAPSARAENAFRAAIASDKTAALFSGLDTPTPVAFAK